MIKHILKKVLSEYTIEGHTIVLIREPFLMDAEELFDAIRPKIIRFSNAEELKVETALPSGSESVILIHDHPESYYADRAFLFNNLKIKYQDIVDDYFNYCITEFYHFDQSTVIRYTKREFLKAFCDNNGIRQFEINSLDGECGVFYSRFCCDTAIVLLDKEKISDRIMVRFDDERVYGSISVSAKQLFAAVFYFSVMSKAWRAGCCYDTDNVLSGPDIYKEINLLDKGYTSVFFKDEEGKYCGTRYLCDYKSAFPGSVKTHFLYIDEASESEMTEQTCFTALKYYNESVPILKNDQVSGFVKKRDELRYTVLMRWDLIDDETLTDLLGGIDRILISSSEEELMRLFQRLSPLKNIQILSSDNFIGLLNGQFDLIISKCDIWDNIPVSFMHLKHLYINAYAYQMKRFFEANDISYHFYCIPDETRISEHRKRVASQSKQFVNNLIKSNNTYTVADGEIGGCLYYQSRRRTTDAPIIWNRSVYFYGPCISIGVFGKDSETIESCLQRMINHAKIPVRVINNPAPLLLNPYDSAINTLHKIGMGKYRKGDIVIHFGRQSLEWEGTVKGDCEKNDLTAVFNSRDHVREKCFIGHMGAHVNIRGYQWIAEYMFSQLFDRLQDRFPKSVFCQFHPENYNDMADGLKRYVEYLNRNKFPDTENKIIGSVAVNANPFTLGHAYLIRSALKKADFLYVFVAQEDLSDFSFEARFDMVTEYCKQFDHVMVLPSGNYFASTISFKDYFNREALDTVQTDATLDCHIFAEVIAKELGISFRMLGEEKHDVITAQYNESVKEILEQNGITVYIIPRCEVNGRPVSAKLVRKHIVERDIEVLRTKVPETTYDYIISRLTD